MSSQKSGLPIRTNGDAHAPHTANDHHQPSATNGNTGTRAHPGKIAIGKRGSVEIDPYASPAVYYGEDQALPEFHKTRTLSAVSPPHSPRGRHTPRTPRSPHAHERRWSLPSGAKWLIGHDTQIEHRTKNPAAIAPGRRTSHGRSERPVRLDLVLI